MLNRFLRYVEIKTKITSLFALLISAAYLYARGQALFWGRSVLFFLAMLLFDFAVTAINNYIDTKTDHQMLPFCRKTALMILWVLLILATGLGLWLVLLTDGTVLVLGLLCFASGVCYTWGPVPISRQPLGEIFSGLFYGGMIPLLFCYINTPPGTYFEIRLQGTALFARLDLEQLRSLGWICLYPILTTANIMLANNICDVEKDVPVHRFTLPYYLGEKALLLFAWGYYSTFFVSLMGLARGEFPAIFSLSLLCFFPVHRNIQKFLREQDKEKTFPVSIANYVMIMGTNTLLLFLGGWMKRL